jgi:hypothetical protein
MTKTIPAAVERQLERGAKHRLAVLQHVEEVSGSGVLFLLGGGGVGWLCGILFLVMGLVPLVLELRASVQRVFLGSFSIFGQQFKESPKAQPSFSSRKMPNPPDAIKPGIGDWAIDILGFVVPAIAGLYVATIWVAAASGAAGS